MNMPKNNLVQQIINTDVVVYSAYSTSYMQLHYVDIYVDKIINYCEAQLSWLPPTTNPPISLIWLN